MPDSHEIKFKNCTIKAEKTVKLLGVTLDHHLTFGPYINETIDRCQCYLGVIARSVPFMPTELLRLTYVALVRSLLEYCSTLLLPVAQTHLRKFDTIQKKAARIILRYPRDAHAEPLLNTLKLEALSDRRNTHAIKLIFSILNKDCHPALHSLFSTLPDNSLEIPKSRTGLGKRRFGIIGAKCFNDQQQRFISTEDHSIND